MDWLREEVRLVDAFSMQGFRVKRSANIEFSIGDWFLFVGDYEINLTEVARQMSRSDERVS